MCGSLQQYRWTVVEARSLSRPRPVSAQQTAAEHRRNLLTRPVYRAASLAHLPPPRRASMSVADRASTSTEDLPSCGSSHENTDAALKSVRSPEVLPPTTTTTPSDRAPSGRTSSTFDAARRMTLPPSEPATDVVGQAATRREALELGKKMDDLEHGLTDDTAVLGVIDDGRRKSCSLTRFAEALTKFRSMEEDTMSEMSKADRRGTTSKPGRGGPLLPPSTSAPNSFRQEIFHISCTAAIDNFRRSAQTIKVGSTSTEPEASWPYRQWVRPRHRSLAEVFTNLAGDVTPKSSEPSDRRLPTDVRMPPRGSRRTLSVSDVAAAVNEDAIISQEKDLHPAANSLPPGNGRPDAAGGQSPFVDSWVEAVKTVHVPTTTKSSLYVQLQMNGHVTSAAGNVDQCSMAKIRVLTNHPPHK